MSDKEMRDDEIRLNKAKRCFELIDEKYEELKARLEQDLMKALDRMEKLEGQRKEAKDYVREKYRESKRRRTHWNGRP